MQHTFGQVSPVGDHAYQVSESHAFILGYKLYSCKEFEIQDLGFV